eukprot:635564-Prorocentrum_minimum.AAC.3
MSSQAGTMSSQAGTMSSQAGTINSQAHRAASLKVLVVPTTHPSTTGSLETTRRVLRDCKDPDGKRHYR